MRKQKNLIEQYTSLSVGKIDRDAGIIHNVKVCGLDSKNGRKYTPEALKNAIKFYERVNVNIDHPLSEEEQTPLARRFGYLEGVHYKDDPSPGLYANLVYNPKHSRADEIIEAAERMPHTLGLSHNAYAKETKQVGKTIVIESIAEVRSVDLVADPATVKGLFESRENKPMKQTIKQLIESAVNELDLPFQVKLWEKYVKDERVEKLLKEEIETPEKSKPSDLIKAGFNALATAAASDESLTPDQAADAVKDVLATKHTMLNGEAPKPQEKKVEETPEKKESVLGVKGANRLCESVKHVPNAKQLEILSECSEETGKMIVEEFARLALVKPEQTPVASLPGDPLKESTEKKPASSAKELAERIR